MTKQETDDTIYDAEFTESPTSEPETIDSEEGADTDNSLVIADPLKPLSPENTEEGKFGVSIKQVLIVTAVIAALILVALYLRGLQLATV